MGKRVSEIIVDTLIAANAKRCYGIVGDTLNQFTDAIAHSEMEWVSVRHEEVAGFAAGGESYLTGELSVCAGTCGPGSLHFINGIFETHRNGSPVVLIATQVPRSEEGLQFPQEVDQKKIYEQCSVFCEYVSHPDQARRITAMAAQAALNKGGVAVVIVNGDMFSEESDDTHDWAVHRPRPIIRPCDEELERIKHALDGAERIAIYAGWGCRNAHDEVVALSKKLNAPVAHTSRSTEFLGYDNPNGVGMTGIFGEPAGYHAVLDCDLLLCLGTNFAWTQFYPEKATILQIDTAAEHIGRRTPVHHGYVGDVKATVEALLPLLDQRDDRAFLDKMLGIAEDDEGTREDDAAENDPTLIHPQFVAQTLDRLADPNAILTADAGSPMVWLLRQITPNGRRVMLTSLMHGTMANAYPQAIGLAHAAPDRQVVAMCGDGGMTMLMGDLLTLVQQKLPVKIVVFNNGSLNFVELEQRVEGLLDNYTTLENPDFGALARSCGMWGARVENAADLEGQMREWLAQDGPALLDVTTARDELVMPPTLTAEQVSGAALYGIKAILHGRAKGLMEMLRDNFLR